MNMNQETMLRFNSWWSTGHLPKHFIWPQKRFSFKQIISRLENPYIVLLTGLRRTGKTVLIYQSIEWLLKQGTPAENIFYYSFEDFPGQRLDELIESYKQIALPKGKIYCFFDEIHYLPNWSNQVKFYFDQKAPIKFLITGSSSHLLFKATSESLAGRINILPLYPMNFLEYLHLKDAEPKLFPKLMQENLTKIFNRQLPLLSFKEKHQQDFQTYLKFGGLPEYLDKSMKIDEWYQFLRQNYLALILFKDILMTYEIRDSRNLLRLAQYLATTVTTTQSLASISTHLGIKKDTLANYIRYLEEAFLITSATYFTSSPTKAIRRNDKIYFTDVGILQALRSTFAPQTEQEVSKIVENLVHEELKAFMMSQTHSEFPPIHYWKNKYEVDFIIRQSTILPIEVKYSNEIKSRDLQGLVEFCTHFDVSEGIVVTKDTFEIIKPSKKVTIYLIPVAIFSALL